MMIDDAADPIVRGMSQLHVLTSDEHRAERVRARCRAGLVSRVRTEERPSGEGLIAGLCFVYLSAVVHSLFRMRGMF